MTTRLVERWRTKIEGGTANTFLVDLPSRSLYVSDGWGVAYPALRLHRLDLATGEPIVEMRTRHQGVSAMTVHAGYLYAGRTLRLTIVCMLAMVTVLACTATSTPEATPPSTPSFGVPAGDGTAATGDLALDHLIAATLAGDKKCACGSRRRYDARLRARPRPRIAAAVQTRGSGGDTR